MDAEGVKKQEDKASYLSTIAHDMYPDISMNDFRDMFQRGIIFALKTNHYTTWQEVVYEQPPARKSFFNTILNAMIPYLQAAGLDQKQIDKLLDKLIKKNRRFLG